MNIRDKVLRGEPLNDILIIDNHVHPEFNGWGFQPVGFADDIIRVMDKLGIDISCICHCASLGADFTWGNDRVGGMLEKYPDRFVGYVTINPLYPDMIRPELERCFAKYKGFIGIKIHPYTHDRPMSHKNYRAVYEYAAENNLCILSHTYNPGDVSTTGKLAEEFPNVKFIMAHTGGYFPCI
jgi:predicted TIM-barrel fold metal-dependent hydrolase